MDFGQKSAKKVSKKGPKKGLKKDQYYSLKQKSEGYFSFFFKNEGRSDRPTSTEDLKSVRVACTLAENRENCPQTDKICSGRGQADVISATRNYKKKKNNGCRVV